MIFLPFSLTFCFWSHPIKFFWSLFHLSNVTNVPNPVQTRCFDQMKPLTSHNVNLKCSLGHVTDGLLRRSNFITWSKEKAFGQWLCGSVGRAVASDTRSPRFESSHRQNLLNICLLSTVFWKDENKEKRGREWPMFWAAEYCLALLQR